MKTLFNFIFIFLSVVLQISILPKISIWAGFPNLVLLIMLCLVFIRRQEEGFWWAVLGGILLDLNTTHYFSIYTITLLVIYFGSIYLINREFCEPPLYMAIGLFLIASAILDIPWLLINSEWQTLFSDAIYNSVVGCVIYLILRYYYKPRETIKV